MSTLTDSSRPDPRRCRLAATLVSVAIGVTFLSATLLLDIILHQ